MATIFITSISFSKKKLAIFQHLTKVGCRLLTESTEAIWKLFQTDDLLNDSPTSSPSPQFMPLEEAEMPDIWRLQQ